MNGLQALQHILEGGKVRVAAWIDGQHIKQEGDILCYVRGNYATPCTWYSSYFTLDWQPYPSPAEEKAELEKVCETCGAYRKSAGLEINLCSDKRNLRWDTKTRRYVPVATDCWHPIPAETPAPDRFWIVWSPEGKTPPQKQYSTHGEAYGDACALAKKNPGQHFYILACKKFLVAEEVAVEPDWEKAWGEIDNHFKSGVMVISEATIKNHDPRNRTEVKVVWRKVKERVL